LLFFFKRESEVTRPVAESTTSQHNTTEKEGKMRRHAPTVASVSKKTEERKSQSVKGGIVLEESKRQTGRASEQKSEKEKERKREEKKRKREKKREKNLRYATKKDIREEKRREHRRVFLDSRPMFSENPFL
jgi:hypothetical protein